MNLKGMYITIVVITLTAVVGISVQVIVAVNATGGC